MKCNDEVDCGDASDELPTVCNKSKSEYTTLKRTNDTKRPLFFIYLSIYCVAFLLFLRLLHFNLSLVIG